MQDCALLEMRQVIRHSPPLPHRDHAIITRQRRRQRASALQILFLFTTGVVVAPEKIPRCVRVEGEKRKEKFS